MVEMKGLIDELGVPMAAVLVVALAMTAIFLTLGPLWCLGIIG